MALELEDLFCKIISVIHFLGGVGVVNYGSWSASFDKGSPGPELLLHHSVIYSSKAVLCMGDLCITPDVQFIFAEQALLHFLLSAHSCQSKYPRDLSWKFPDLLFWDGQDVGTLVPKLVHLWAFVLFSQAGVWTRLMGFVRPSRRQSTRLFRRLWISWRKTVTSFVPPSAVD